MTDWTLVGDAKRIGVRATTQAFVDTAALLADNAIIPPRVVLVCDTLTQDELNRLLLKARGADCDVEMTQLGLIGPPSVSARRHHLAELPRPELSEELVPAAHKSGYTRVWYISFLRHCLGLVQPKKCLVLSGPPGVGKTLAAERLGAIMNPNGTERLVGTVENEYGYFSCADVEDGDDVKMLFNRVSEFLRTTRGKSVLILDDAEVLVDDENGHRESAKRAELFTLLGKEAPCRRVIIVQDFYDRANNVLRDDTRFEHYHVDRAHIPSLAAFIMQKVPTLARQPDAAKFLAEQSGGDVRAALIAASFDATVMPVLARANARTLRSVGIDADSRSVPLPIHILVRQAVRAGTPREIVAKAREAVAGADLESVEHVMYANYPRIGSAQTKRRDVAEEACERLVALARTAEALSDADAHDQATWDDEGRFELGVGIAALTLGAALTEASHSYAVEAKLEFPLWRLRAAQNECASHMGVSLELRSAIESGTNTTLQEYTETFADDTATNHGPAESAKIAQLREAVPVLLGRFSPHEFGEALQQATARKRTLTETTWDRLQTVIVAFGAFGIDASGFAELTLPHLCWSGVSLQDLTHKKLVDLYRSVAPVVGPEQQVSGGRSVAATRIKVANTAQKRKQGTIDNFVFKLVRK